MIKNQNYVKQPEANVNGSVSLELFLKKISSGGFLEARNISDELIGMGIHETDINYYAYPLFKQILQKNLNRARKLAEVFKDYSWEYWLQDNKGDYLNIQKLRKYGDKR